MLLEWLFDLREGLVDGRVNGLVDLGVNSSVQ